MLVATVILTWMIFWMRKQAVNIKDQLQSQIQSTLGSGSALGLIGLAFFVVVREGIETVLFLFVSTRTTESPILSLLGGIIGLTIAITIGYGIYKGTARLNLKTFFNMTSLLLILFAAGLLAHGLHEFQEVKLIPNVMEHIWDINHVIAEDSIFGRFLTAIFGYNANPSLVEFTSYSTYLVLATASYFYPILRKKGGG